jgi:hypothetical protein
LHYFVSVLRVFTFLRSSAWARLTLKLFQARLAFFVAGTVPNGTKFIVTPDGTPPSSSSLIILMSISCEPALLPPLLPPPPNMPVRCFNPLTKEKWFLPVWPLGRCAGFIAAAGGGVAGALMASMLVVVV